MNDGTSRRTTSPVITAKCCLPLKREECQLLHQRATLLTAQAFPSAFSHLRTDQIWTCIISQNLAEPQPVADSMPIKMLLWSVLSVSFFQLDWLPLRWLLNSVTSSKRPAARYRTAHDNSLALKWLWNPTASERDTDIVAQQGDVYQNDRTRHTKGIPHLLMLKGSHPKYHSTFPSHRQVPDRSNSFLEGH